MSQIMKAVSRANDNRGFNPAGSAAGLNAGGRLPCPWRQAKQQRQQLVRDYEHFVGGVWQIWA